MPLPRQLKCNPNPAKTFVQLLCKLTKFVMRLRDSMVWFRLLCKTVFTALQFFVESSIELRLDILGLVHLLAGGIFGQMVGLVQHEDW